MTSPHPDPLRKGEGLRNNPWVTLVVLCAGFFMILLDTTVVQIAVPSISDGLHASLDQILWVINAYILVYAVLLITAGRLGDVYGQRNLFVIGLVIFTGASAYCGLAPDITHLVVARVIQGTGGALLTPQTLAILTTLFPPDKRGAAFGVWGGIAGLAAVAGPTLGGWLVTSFSWRGIFFINLPVGVATLIAALLLVPDLRPGTSHGFDVGGVLLASGGLFGIVYGLVEGQRFNWGTIVGPISIPLVLGLGVALMVLFVWVERRQAEPLMPLSLFNERNFTLMNGIAIVISFGMLGLFLPVIIYFQSVLGMTALQAGLTVLPMSILIILVAPLSGRFSDKFGGKYILFAGCLLAAIGMGSIAWVAGPSSTGWTFLPSFLITGLGMGMVFAPMSTVAMRNVSVEMAGAASGVFNTTRQLGSVIGSAVVGAILETQLATALRQQAIAAANQVPAAFRQQLVQGFSNAGQSGLDVGKATNPAGQLPPGIPPQVAAQLTQLIHTIFANAFIQSLGPTLLAPVALMFVGALSTLAIKRRANAGAGDGTETAPEPLAIAV